MVARLWERTLGMRAPSPSTTPTGLHHGARHAAIVCTGFCTACVFHQGSAAVVSRSGDSRGDAPVSWWDVQSARMPGLVGGRGGGSCSCFVLFGADGFDCRSCSGIETGIVGVDQNEERGVGRVLLATRVRGVFRESGACGDVEGVHRESGGASSNGVVSR